MSHSETVVNTDDQNSSPTNSRRITKFPGLHSIDGNPAWLSVESTIEEINVIEQYFRISGCIAVFWQDMLFDKDNDLQKLKCYKPYSNKKLKDLLSIRMGAAPTKGTYLILEAHVYHCSSLRKHRSTTQRQNLSTMTQ